MAEIKNLDRLIHRLKVYESKWGEAAPEVTVGYTQAYAVYVHENLEAHHPVGQAKFLEQPARELQPELARIVAEALRRNVKLGKALLMAGLRLQRESQQRCPVDTGALRASAFTRIKGE